jgi:fructokinase
MKALLGAIEAGGTEFVCAVAEEAGPILVDKRIIPTTTPSDTLAEAIRFFSPYRLRSLGVACFGPIDLKGGTITTTPKAEWSGTEIVRPLQQALNVPVGFDTDVNGAALGEGRYGAGIGKDPLVYVTVGTGIGAGVLISGRPVHGRMHPEAGHMSVKRHPDDLFVGSCPYHSDCLEGLASGPAIHARWGSPGQDIPTRHPAWKLEAYYLAQALCNMILLLSPQRIVLGGGVMHRADLLSLIHDEVRTRLGGYIPPLEASAAIEDLIVPAALGDNAGIIGALVIAQDAAPGD